MKYRTISIGVFYVLCLSMVCIFSEVQAQEEFEDTPYFSGMPNYRISEAIDQEFADYNFFNGEDCTTMEGRNISGPIH